MSDPLRHRPRRMRRTPALRALIRETELAALDLSAGGADEILGLVRP